MIVGRPPLQQLDSRLAGLAAAIVLHVLLVVVWKAALRIQIPVQAEPSYTQWLQLPERIRSSGAADETGPGEPHRMPTGGNVATSRPPPTARAERHSAIDAATPPLPVSDRLEADRPPSSAVDVASANHVDDMVAQAKREAGDIDRTLRKESKPYIVAPLDSPHIRMAKKFREAAALAPNRLWEAPKVVELVNDGGDGARRTRVLTALGIYCITERSPATSIDMIERHGKQRITNCGHEHEQPANPQEWRTARD